AVSPQLDALYTTLCRHFGLPSTPEAAKLVVDVSLTQNPGSALLQPHNYERFVMGDRLVVASPALYWAPLDLTDEQLLAQALALPLVEQVLGQAREGYAIRTPWQPLLSGLELWQVWHLALPLSTWREAVVQWLYVDLPNASPGQAFVLPAHYAELC